MKKKSPLISSTKMNPKASTAAPFHDRTSYQRHKMSGHFLDWGNQPSVYKTYTQAESVLLPRDVSHPEETLSQVLKKGGATPLKAAINLADLSRLFDLTYSITAKARLGGTDFYYRSAASAGALYPTEIYMAAKGVEGLDDGLYYFTGLYQTLILLRKGDVSQYVANTVSPEARKSPALTLFLTAIFFRSAWKYRERSYRYHLLDTGHVAENLVIALKALGFPYLLSYDFDDHVLNRLLGVDETKEVCLAVCRVPGPQSLDKRREGDLPELPETVKEASRVADRERDYPAIREIHEAGCRLIPSSLEGPSSMVDQLGFHPAEFIEIVSADTWSETTSCADVFHSRRSRRNYVPTPLSKERTTALLECLTLSGYELASEGGEHFQSIATGFLVGRAEGVEPGLYLLDSLKGSFGMVRSGLFMDKMARVCLDQAWLAHAALHFLFMADLHRLDKYWGARGYRYAMLTAGRLGERLYLAANAMGLGCCGIGAFYDKEAAELLGLKGGSRLLYLVAVGPVKSAKLYR